MNGKICKKLRKVALELPAIKTLKFVSEKKYGHEIDDKERTDRNGKKIDDKVIYNHRYTTEGFLDHYENLKVIYEKEGQKGVISYSGYITKLALAREREEKQQAIMPQNNLSLAKEDMFV